MLAIRLYTCKPVSFALNNPLRTLKLEAKCLKWEKTSALKPSQGRALVSPGELEWW